MCFSKIFQTCIRLICHASEFKTLRFDCTATTEWERKEDVSSGGVGVVLLWCYQNIVLIILDIFAFVLAVSLTVRCFDHFKGIPIDWEGKYDHNTRWV